MIAAADLQGKSALHIVAAKWGPDPVRLLLRKGADVNAETNLV